MIAGILSTSSSLRWLQRPKFDFATSYLFSKINFSPDDVTLRTSAKQNGFILVSASGVLNQQRVAVCNAVVVAYLLNATLVLPRFLYSSVWRDVSQFGDIYQEDYFIDILQDDLNIVRELPDHFQTLDIEAIGSQVTDAHLGKESKPMQLIEKVLPLLLKNGVVHFLGFVNRLGFDPVPPHLQKLRCKCNFHTEDELAPFKNFSSRMAELDFIACAVADVFAMTDLGSQLSSLVSGLRVYHGGGHAPILRPNKKLLAELFSQNSSSVTWRSFSDQVKNMFRDSHKGKSIYHDPRSPGCMCMV